MSEEIKIITLGDIFKNIETEEKAFKFKDYIKDLQQKVEQLEEENDDLKNRLENEVAENTLRLKEVEQLEKERLQILNVLNNQMGYREYVDIINTIDNILNKGSK